VAIKYQQLTVAWTLDYSLMALIVTTKCHLAAVSLNYWSII